MDLSRESSRPEKFSVGIDPGSQHVGLSLFADESLVNFRRVSSYAGKNAAQRVIALSAKVETALTDMLGYAPVVAPVTCYIELPGSQTKGRAGGLISLGMGVGAMSILAVKRGFTPNFVKVADWSRLAGGVCRSKEDRAIVLEHFFPTYRAAEDAGLDISDAIGVAAWGLGLFDGRKEEIERLIGKKSKATPRG